MIKVTQFIQKPLKVLTMISVMAVSIFLLSCEDDEAPFDSVPVTKNWADTNLLSVQLRNPYR